MAILFLHEVVDAFEQRFTDLVDPLPGDSDTSCDDCLAESVNEHFFHHAIRFFWQTGVFLCFHNDITGNFSASFAD